MKDLDNNNKDVGRAYQVKTAYAELMRIKKIYSSNEYSIVDFEAYLDDRIDYYGSEAKAIDGTFNYEGKTSKTEGK